MAHDECNDDIEVTNEESIVEITEETPVEVEVSVETTVIEADCDEITVSVDTSDVIAVDVDEETTEVFVEEESIIVETDCSQGIPGSDGREVELRTSGGYVQWRYVGDEEWQNLYPISTSGSIANWDSGIVYNTGDLVIYENTIYQSLVDDNEDYQPDESPDEWQVIGSSGSGSEFWQIVNVSGNDYLQIISDTLGVAFEDQRIFYRQAGDIYHSMGWGWTDYGIDGPVIRGFGGFGLGSGSSSLADLVIKAEGTDLYFPQIPAPSGETYLLTIDDDGLVNNAPFPEGVLPSSAMDNDILVYNGTNSTWEAEQLIIGKPSDAYGYQAASDDGTYEYVFKEDKDANYFVVRINKITETAEYTAGTGGFSSVYVDSNSGPAGSPVWADYGATF